MAKKKSIKTKAKAKKKLRKIKKKNLNSKTTSNGGNIVKSSLNVKENTVKHKISNIRNIKNVNKDGKSIKKKKYNVNKGGKSFNAKKGESKKGISVIGKFKASLKYKKSIVKKNTGEKNKDGVVLNEKIKIEGDKHNGSKRFRFIKKVLFFFLKVFGVLFVLMLIFVGVIWWMFGKDLPDVSVLKDMTLAETSVIYDRDGNVLYSVFEEENRKYLPLSKISPFIYKATISIEDKKFYSHFGFDPVGILRAQISNMRDKDSMQGASTITQQLAKNVFLSPERTYKRKIKELLLSLQIEWHFSKDDILEMYLNKIPYGSNAFGVEAASETFFGKSASDVSLVEASVLASLPKAPTYFSPYGQNKDELMGYCELDREKKVDDVENEEVVLDEDKVVDVENKDAVVDKDKVGDDSLNEDEGAIEEDVVNEVSNNDSGDVIDVDKPATRCKSMFDVNYIAGRKDAVLKRMVDDKYITQQEADVAWLGGFSVNFLPPVHKIESPHFVFYIKELLEKKYGKDLIENGGLEIVTTLDPSLQATAEEIVHGRAEYNKSHFNADNAALIALDPKTGAVLAMVGSQDYWDSSIDGQVNVTTSMRQPGSSFKPLIYTAAVQNGKIGSGSILSDYKTKFNKTYVPHNSDNRYLGKTTVRKALAWSRNIPAIKAWYIAGEEEKVLDFLDKIGITSLREFKNEFNKESKERGWTFNFGPAMAIGSGETSLLQLMSGYTVLANNGYRHPINPILEVRDRNGEILEKYSDSGEQVIDAQAAYIVTSIISDVYARPGGSWRNGLTIKGHTVAAKTGTSNKKIRKANYPNNLLTVGYTPDVAVGVWVGNSDGSALYRNAWGLTGAAPIWKAFMSKILKDVPDKAFDEPEGIVHKGRELYPSYYVARNLDSIFKREDKSICYKNEPNSDACKKKKENEKKKKVEEENKKSLVEPPSWLNVDGDGSVKDVEKKELPPVPDLNKNVKDEKRAKEAIEYGF